MKNNIQNKKQQHQSDAKGNFCRPIMQIFHKKEKAGDSADRKENHPSDSYEQEE